MTVKKGRLPPEADPKPSALGVAVAGKAAGDAAMIAATWPEPNWSHWLAADHVTLEEAAALTINKEPGQDRAFVEAGKASAVRWVIPSHTFPEAYRRLTILRERFPASGVRLSELAAYALEKRWFVPEQISRLFVPTTDTTETRQAARYQACIDAGLALPNNDYARLPVGVGEVAARLGISRPSLAADVKAHIARLVEQKRKTAGR